MESETKELYNQINQPGFSGKLRVIGIHLLRIADEFDKIDKVINEQFQKQMSKRSPKR